MINVIIKCVYYCVYYYYYQAIDAGTKSEYSDSAGCPCCWCCATLYITE